ncbi:MAG: hypothetical protein FWF97_03670 [Alphaproteobacteria bacterium]|nr:hypothetical protein [Alphaproteobacteria bacterium]
MAPKTKFEKYIEKTTGMSIEEICNTSSEELSKIAGTKGFSYGVDPLSSGRVITREEVDARFDETVSLGTERKKFFGKEANNKRRVG